ncbi:MAG TPA: hypothetical protein VEC57_13830 [Candidatus Limnocylindrales bacterium]|nr:hypothetical protein [Candidatus Limnocylindrales bacterium]
MSAGSNELRRGWEAIDGAAALVGASSLALLVATGEERLEFLHGQTSNDVRGLLPGAGCAALSLTPQGRPLAIFSLYNDAEHERVLIATTTQERAAVRAALERFLVADDCEVEEAPELTAWTLAGPQAPAVLERAGIAGVRDDASATNERAGATAGADASAAASTAAAAWRLHRGRIGEREVLVLQRGDLRVPAFDILAADAQLQTTYADPVAAALREAGAVDADAQALEVVRVESGTARYGTDVDESRIAIEARLEWAIHFGKGCYVGQEVIERAVSRGRIQHMLALLAGQGLTAGAQVVGGGERDVATSVVDSPRLGRIALAYLPAGQADAGGEVQLRSDAGTHVATVLPWPRARVLAGRDGRKDRP